MSPGVARCLALAGLLASLSACTDDTPTAAARTPVTDVPSLAALLEEAGLPCERLTLSPASTGLQQGYCDLHYGELQPCGPHDPTCLQRPAASLQLLVTRPVPEGSGTSYGLTFDNDDVEVSGRNWTIWAPAGVAGLVARGTGGTRR